MKWILVILLFCGLICTAQDSSTYAQFRYDFMNVDIVQPEKIRFVDNPVYKPAMILLGTFALNQVLIAINEDNNYFNTGMITGSIFIAGAAWSVIVFSNKHKHYERRN